jgi:hypothetical protein
LKARGEKILHEIPKLSPQNAYEERKVATSLPMTLIYEWPVVPERGESVAE